jgi:hypothetical protein
MDKFKKSLSLAVVACGTVGFSQASLAQYVRIQVIAAEGMREGR